MAVAGARSTARKSKAFSESVTRKRMRHTLLPSVHSSEPDVGKRSYHASDPLLFFAAVKNMALSSPEAIGPEVPDGSPFSAPSPRGVMVQKFQMHAYSLVSSGVCWCATNEVVQFFVCCGTFVLLVGLLFSTRSWFFSGHVSFDAL